MKNFSIFITSDNKTGYKFKPEEDTLQSTKKLVRKLLKKYNGMFAVVYVEEWNGKHLGWNQWRYAYYTFKINKITSRINMIEIKGPRSISELIPDKKEKE